MENERFGSWPSNTDVGQVESHLLTTQTKFKRYKLNVFDLNHVSKTDWRLNGAIVVVCPHLAALVLPQEAGEAESS